MNPSKQKTLFQTWGRPASSSCSTATFWSGNVSNAFNSDLRTAETDNGFNTDTRQRAHSMTCDEMSEMNELINLCDDDDMDDETLLRAVEESMNPDSSVHLDRHPSSHLQKQNSLFVQPNLCNVTCTVDLNSSMSLGADTNIFQSQSQVAVIPGFDRVAGKLWIYPTNYSVREYQFHIVQHALFKNTLVVLPTGLGKTFIAAVVMYNYYRWYPQGKIVFMAPTRPLVAQQIEACYKIMGIPQDDTAEMTGTLPPAERCKAWQTKRVFFLTPQVLTNDLSRAAMPADVIKCLVVDEAHKALGNHAYCQVVRELVKYSRDFRMLALSATPGSDIKAVQQVLANLLISHIELRTEESIDIQPYTHERTVEKIIIPLGQELLEVKQKYLQILEVVVNRLIRQRVLYNRPVPSFSKFLILKARDAFRQNPPEQLQRSQFGVLEGDFAMAMSLYHGFELLQQHGLRSLYNFLDGIINGDKSYGRTRTELMRNANFTDLMNKLGDKFRIQQRIASTGGEDMPPFVVGHPKMPRLEEIIVEHFNKFNQADETTGPASTRVMIFAQYRDSVNEITDMLRRHKPLVKVMNFIGQSSAGKSSKGFSQKLQMKVMRDFREGGYNTLVSTCVGEEGLDIGDVDLIICFDAHKSPIRLVQRMGRTGRKRQGRIVMLVTEGKEEQIYNQSQYSKRSIHKAILNGAKLLKFYPYSPAMLPANLSPQCHKMHITVQESFNGQKKRKNAAAGDKGQGKIKDSVRNAGSSKSVGEESAFLSQDELEYWNKHYKIPEEELASLSESKFLSLKKGYQRQGTCVESGPAKRTLSLNEWLPWQNRRQDIHKIGHSLRTDLLVDIVQFVELQQTLDPEGDSYGVEMSLYLDKDDVMTKTKRLSDITRYCTPVPVDQTNATDYDLQNDRRLKMKRINETLPNFDTDDQSNDSDKELPPLTNLLHLSDDTVAFGESSREAANEDVSLKQRQTDDNEINNLYMKGKGKQLKTKNNLFKSGAKNHVSDGSEMNVKHSKQSLGNEKPVIEIIDECDSADFVGEHGIRTVSDHSRPTAEPPTVIMHTLKDKSQSAVSDSRQTMSGETPATIVTLNRSNTIKDIWKNMAISKLNKDNATALKRRGVVDEGDFDEVVFLQIFSVFSDPLLCDSFASVKSDLINEDDFDNIIYPILDSPSVSDIPKMLEDLGDGKGLGDISFDSIFENWKLEHLPVVVNYKKTDISAECFVNKKLSRSNTRNGVEFGCDSDLIFVDVGLADTGSSNGDVKPNITSSSTPQKHSNLKAGMNGFSHVFIVQKCEQDVDEIVFSNPTPVTLVKTYSDICPPSVFCVDKLNMKPSNTLNEASSSALVDGGRIECANEHCHSMELIGSKYSVGQDSKFGAGSVDVYGSKTGEVTKNKLELTGCDNNSQKITDSYDSDFKESLNINFDINFSCDLPADFSEINILDNNVPIPQSEAVPQPELIAANNGALLEIPASVLQGEARDRSPVNSTTHRQLESNKKPLFKSKKPTCLFPVDSNVVDNTNDLLSPVHGNPGSSVSSLINKDKQVFIKNKQRALVKGSSDGQSVIPSRTKQDLSMSAANTLQSHEQEVPFSHYANKDVTHDLEVTTKKTQYSNSAIHNIKSLATCQTSTPESREGFIDMKNRQKDEVDKNNFSALFDDSSDQLLLACLSTPGSNMKPCKFSVPQITPGSHMNRGASTSSQNTPGSHMKSGATTSTKNTPGSHIKTDAFTGTQITFTQAMDLLGGDSFNQSSILISPSPVKRKKELALKGAAVAHCFQEMSRCSSVPDMMSSLTSDSPELLENPVCSKPGRNSPVESSGAANSSHSPSLINPKTNISITKSLSANQDHSTTNTAHSHCDRSRTNKSSSHDDSPPTFDLGFNLGFDFEELEDEIVPPSPPNATQPFLTKHSQSGIFGNKANSDNPGMNMERKSARVNCVNTLVEIGHGGTNDGNNNQMSDKYRFSSKDAKCNISRTVPCDSLRSVHSVEEFTECVPGQSIHVSTRSKTSHISNDDKPQCVVATCRSDTCKTNPSDNINPKSDQSIACDCKVKTLWEPCDSKHKSIAASPVINQASAAAAPVYSTQCHASFQLDEHTESLEAMFTSTFPLSLPPSLPPLRQRLGVAVPPRSGRPSATPVVAVVAPLVKRTEGNAALQLDVVSPEMSPLIVRRRQAFARRLLESSDSETEMPTGASGNAARCFPSAKAECENLKTQSIKRMDTISVLASESWRKNFSDDDFQDACEKRSPVAVTTVTRKREKAEQKHPHSERMKRKRQKYLQVGHRYLDVEAELSENSQVGVSSDEEHVSDWDGYDLSFINDCTQMSQAAQPVDQHALYLRSIRSPVAPSGRYRLQFKSQVVGDIFSQEVQNYDDETEYMHDSFCVGSDFDDTGFLSDHAASVHSKHKKLTKKNPKFRDKSRKRILRNSNSSSDDNTTSDIVPSQSLNISRKTGARKKARVIESSDEDINDSSHQSHTISPRQQFTIGKNMTNSLSNNEDVRSLSNKDSVNSNSVHSYSEKPVSNATPGSERSAIINIQQSSVSVIHGDSMPSNRNMQALERNVNSRSLANSSTSSSNRLQDAGRCDLQETIFDACNRRQPDSGGNGQTQHSVTSRQSSEADFVMPANLSRVHSKLQPVVFVDSREIGGAQDVVSCLRLTHKLNVTVQQLTGCDYIISNRLAVERKQWTDFANGSHRNKLIERIQSMRELFDRHCLIIEKDRVKSGQMVDKPQMRTKYVDHCLALLSQTSVIVYFTDNQVETAALLSDLCKLEERKGMAITYPITLTAEKQRILNFFISIPKLSYVNALNLALNFNNVVDMVNSTTAVIEKKGRMSSSRAEMLHKYIHSDTNLNVFVPS